MVNHLMMKIKQIGLLSQSEKENDASCYLSFMPSSQWVKCFRPQLKVIFLQTGQLNEYTERKEMTSEVVCMALANVPHGEQRSRFLAVGLADNTVRVISLDPNVSHSSPYHSFVTLNDENLRLEF